MPATSCWSRSRHQGSVGAPMTMLRRICLLFSAVAASAVATAAAIGFSVTPASAAAPGLCGVIPVLCPPTTPPKTAPPTTAPPATTTPPTTARPTVTTAVRKAASTAARVVAPAVASVGGRGLSAPASEMDLPALGGTDAAAPQLAPAAAPTFAATSPQTVLSGLVGATGSPLGHMPSYHSRLRLALSVLVLLIAAVAAAQLPESRRAPQPEEPAI